MNSDSSTERREGGVRPAALQVREHDVWCAEPVQRIMCKRRYVRAGRIPHVRGSSSSEESCRPSHYTRWALGPDRAQDSGRTSRDGYRLEKPHVRNNFSRGSRGGK